MGDVDGDGNIDLVSIGDHGSPYINTDQHGIMVWFGDGTGTWSVYMRGNFGYGGVALGDVNNDEYMDVGYGMHHNYSGTDFGDQLLEVALGDGTGQNWQPWDDSLATNGETWGMFCTDFADVDNDGDMDIGANSFGYGAGVHVYLNQGDGTWIQSFGFLGGNSLDDFVFGDVNADGNPDFAVAHQFGTVYMGDGTGSFTLGDGNLPHPGTIGHGAPDLGDVDNDGGDDLSFANSDGGVEVWAWESPNTWVDLSGSLPAFGDYSATQLFDMDVDGHVDLAAFGRGTVTIWTGNGAGGWTQAATFNTPSPGYFEAFRVGGDADHNGYPDIVLVADEGSWPNDRNHLRFYKEASSPDSLWIKPIYPRGGEKFWIHSIHFIDWASGVPGGQPAVVRLELSTMGPGGPWTLVGDSLPNNGRYQWTVPDSPSPDCHVRYRILAGSDSALAQTPTPFEIISQPHVSEGSSEPRMLPSLLGMPFPNPFGVEGTAISFTVQHYALDVSLKVYDLAGRPVKTLLDGPKQAGHYRATWDGTDNRGRPVAGGVYYLRFGAGNLVSSRQVGFLR